MDLEDMGRLLTAFNEAQGVLGGFGQNEGSYNGCQVRAKPVRAIYVRGLDWLAACGEICITMYMGQFFICRFVVLQRRSPGDLASVIRIVFDIISLCGSDWLSALAPEPSLTWCYLFCKHVPSLRYAALAETIASVEKRVPCFLCRQSHLLLAFVLPPIPAAPQ